MIGVNANTDMSRGIAVETRAALRAQRLAARVSNGDEIFATLRDALPQMVQAAERSLPAVTAVSATLSKKFPEDMASTSVRQFVGLAIRAIMEGAGYEVAQQGIRVKDDQLFTVGAVYRRRSAEKGALEDDALARMLKALSPEQARRASQILRQNFPQLASQRGPADE